jgi:hypothetical protein
MNFLRKQPKKARRVDVCRCPGHLAYVRNTFKCIVPDCENMPIQAMHIVQPGNGRIGSKTDDDRVLPGCAFHHTDGSQSYHRIGRDKFAKLHGLDLEKLIEQVNKDSKPLQRYRSRQQGQ